MPAPASTRAPLMASRVLELSVSGIDGGAWFGCEWTPHETVVALAGEWQAVSQMKVLQRWARVGIALKGQTIDGHEVLGWRITQSPAPAGVPQPVTAEQARFWRLCTEALPSLGDRRVAARLWHPDDPRRPRVADPTLEVPED